MFPYQEVLGPISVDDVTDDPKRMEVARRLVAESYARLSSQELDPEEVYRELCLDEYQEHGASRTFLATGYNPNTDRVEPLGTIRIVLGRGAKERNGLEPLEFMGLFEASGGWDDFQFEGFDPERAAEGGRFVVSPRCRAGKAREFALPAHVLRRLLEGVFTFLRRSGLDQFWGVMPRYVTRVLEAAGFDALPAPGIRLDHEKNAGLFEKYDRYWKHSSPHLYRVYSSADTEATSSAAGAAFRRESSARRQSA